MMLKKISSFFLLFILIFSLSSCSGRAQLLFLNWGEYIDEELFDLSKNINAFIMEKSLFLY